MYKKLYKLIFVGLLFLILLPEFVLADTFELKEGYYILTHTSMGVLRDGKRYPGTPDPVSVRDDGTYEMIKLEKDLLGVFGGRIFGMDANRNIIWSSETLIHNEDMDVRTFLGELFGISLFYLEGSEIGLDLVLYGVIYDPLDPEEDFSK